jgi:hypothetical protein
LLENFKRTPRVPSRRLGSEKGDSRMPTADGMVRRTSGHSMELPPMPHRALAPRSSRRYRIGKKASWTERTMATAPAKPSNKDLAPTAPATRTRTMAASTAPSLTGDVGGGPTVHSRLGFCIQRQSLKSVLTDSSV